MKEVKQQTSRGKVTKKFKFKSKVIVWGTDWHDSSAWRFARVPENISANLFSNSRE